MDNLRIARPVSDLVRATDMYCRGLGLRVIGGFEDHDGFDGVMLGVAGASYHFELTHCRTHPVVPTPTAEDLIVFYVPTASEWQAMCDVMLAAGFKQVAPFNPYWDRRGRTFQDDDGYRVVLQRAEWSNVEGPESVVPRRDGHNPRDVVLEAAGPADAPLLSNLLELYIHELSAAFPDVEMGPDGRFGYSQLPLYWSDPERRFAFLIRCAGRVAGFVLATRGSPATTDPAVLDVAEFFVLRRYRRSRVGRRAAFLLWKALPGKWTVRASEGNPEAVLFWADVITEFTNGAVIESTRPGKPNAWRVFSFERATQRIAD